MSRAHLRQSGTVSLVALCFVAVLGITLASYIAVCSRAMNLSNRSFQVKLSQQLAELGIDEAMRAFNKNNWANWSNGGVTVTWDTTTYAASKGAIGAVSFTAGKFGQGVTATVKIRMDNYDANQLNSTWNSSANYQINDLVSYSGFWYRCVQSHSNQTPNRWANLTYWVPAPMGWAWNSGGKTYSLYDAVNVNGVWYRCKAAHTSSSATKPPNAARWTSMAGSFLPWSNATAYSVDDFVYYTGNNTWYRCILAHSNQLPTNTTYWSAADTSTPTVKWIYNSAYSYSFGDIVYNNSIGTWFRCIASANPGYAPTVQNADWEYARSGTMFRWNPASINYNLGDVIYYSTTATWYRCILAHTSSGSITPTNTTYWSVAPRSSRSWDSAKQYSQNDTVIYKGVRYLSLQNSSIGQNPATATTYWIGANTATASYQWDAATAYVVGDYRCYGGVWYNCTAAHTGHSPNDTAYWTNAWAQGAGVTTGAPVVYAEGTIAIAGSPSVRTQLRATIASAPLFPNAAASTTTISANSGGTVDSYDSTTGTSAVQPGVANGAGTSGLISGTYASQVGTATNYSAVVAAGSTAGTAITLSSTTVSGYVAAPSSSTTPYAPLISIGSSGSVKSLTSPASPNVDTSRVSRSPFIPQFDPLPSGGLATNWSSVPKGTQLNLGYNSNIGTPGATTPSRYYINGSLTLGTAIYNSLSINGPVILYINGDLTITAAGSTGRIDINSTGSAEIHVAGAFTADAPGDGIQNYTGDPKSLIIICDTTSTATHFYSEGVNDLYGVIYIPYSTSNTGYYNDNNNTEIFGAVSASKITYSGANMNIHYDTSLRYATFGGVDQPYTITEWRELPIDEQATMP